jgi:Mg2+ and Co2+ transporter CorA
MELLDKYREEINKDLVFNEINIKDAQYKLPSRKHFWCARLIDAKITLYKLNKSKKDLKEKLSKALISQSPVKLTQQGALAAVENAEQIRDITDQIKDYEILVEYLERVEKIFSTMHWEIKNIIEINRQEQL